MTTHPLTTLAAVPAPVSNGPDPYTYYESRGKGKGKGPPHPIVPEVADYGLILMVFSVAFILFVRLWRTRNKTPRSTTL